MRLTAATVANAMAAVHDDADMEYRLRQIRYLLATGFIRAERTGHGRTHARYMNIDQCLATSVLCELMTLGLPTDHMWKTSAMVDSSEFKSALDRAFDGDAVYLVISGFKDRSATIIGAEELMALMPQLAIVYDLRRLLPLARAISSNSGATQDSPIRLAG